MGDIVRSQYERFPYPPIPSFALPLRGQGESLRFENVTHRLSPGIRILIVGCGTFEALVAAQIHKEAREVVALDFSQNSLKVLRRRLLFSNLSRPFGKRAPISTVCADVERWEPSEKFDYIIASNVIHHVADPAALLARLSGWLHPEGLLRMVTYPRFSRIWMRETAAWFRLNGLTPETPALRERCRMAIAALPSPHPIRSCFESQPETGRTAGLVDAFFSALENPLSPLQWKNAASFAGLELIEEGQNETSRSAFLDEIYPAAAALGRWEKLEILDRLLELCANPVFYFRKFNEASPASALPGLSHREASLPAGTPLTTHTFALPEPGPLSIQSEARAELAASFAAMQSLLSPQGANARDLAREFRERVGPRTARGTETSLPLLTFGEYPEGDAGAWRSVQIDWEHAEYELGPGYQLLHGGIPAPGRTLAEQASWWQRIHGPFMKKIPLELRKV